MAEMRLIDANALKKKTRRMYAPDEIDSIAPIATTCITYDDVCRAPTIDAVPVVRCGQCAKAKKFRNPQMGDLILCNEYRVFTDECGFCHKGAKMDGGAEG